jgi:PIN domain nuclease of toxin-antitoxin system
MSSLANTLFLSSVSVWELMLKITKGRLIFPDEPVRYLPEMRKKYHLHSLSLSEEDALYVAKLPSHHYDPFDRMLIAQALCQNLVILTPDAQFTKYPVKVFW